MSDRQPGSRRTTKKRGHDEAVDSDTGRTTITLPAFQLYELRSLKAIYGATLTQVVEWIVGDWLAANQQNIEIRRRRHADFLDSERDHD